MMLRVCISVFVCMTVLVCAASLAAQPADYSEPPAEAIWPGQAPGEPPADRLETVENRKVDRNESGLNRSHSHVTRPTIAVHLPPPDKATGAAAVICPGGGYGRVVIDMEGHDVARRLNSFGVAGIVLTYRTKKDRDEPVDRPLADVQRAVRIVRSRAEKLNVDPDKIGVMGFSAGGNLAATIGTRFGAGNSDAADPIERVSCRPDFLGLIYPAWLDRLADKVTGDTPPAFLVHAGDDRLPAEHTARFYVALQETKVPAELHVFTKGGDGFGLGVRGGPVAAWPDLFADWLKQIGIMQTARRQYGANPFIIPLEIPAPDDDKGSIVAADLNADGRKDFLVTVPGHVAAYDNGGRKLWILKEDIRISMDSEQVGLPGQHAPGVQAADVDGDGDTEVLFLTQDSTIHVVAGATGREEWTARLPVPDGAERWEHLVVADFRGRGDVDLLLQTTNAKGYRMGRYLSAHACERLRRGDLTPLWKMDDFLACAHTAARVADLDGDGRDEVIGGTLVSPEGKVLFRFPLTGHIDAIAIDDVRPDIPGLEVVAVEEGDRRREKRDRTFLANLNGLLWEKNHQNREPQDEAVGDFDPERPGLEIFCRHRGPGLAAKPIPLGKFTSAMYQRPFVLDARGNVISEFSMEHVRPEAWNPMGLQVCQTIHWTGGAKPLVVATEREQNGTVAIFDAIGGKFVLHLDKEKADRLYVCDVSGDWREEIIILNGNELHIYHNAAPNPNPDRPRLWEQSHYARSKMTWNRSSN